MYRLIELAMLLDAAMARNDMDAAKKLAAEQRAEIERQYAERERASLAADSF
jgi:hypothetical protein